MKGRKIITPNKLNKKCVIATLLHCLPVTVEAINAVVVPIFEPIIIPTLFVKLKIPASTNDTSITVTAVLD